MQTQEYNMVDFYSMIKHQVNSLFVALLLTVTFSALPGNECPCYAGYSLLLGFHYLCSQLWYDSATQCRLLQIDLFNLEVLQNYKLQALNKQSMGQDPNEII